MNAVVVILHMAYVLANQPHEERCSSGCTGVILHM